MRGARRPHTRAVIAFVAVVASIGAAFGACTNYQRSDGSGCIKDVDCLSGYCIAQVCGTPNPTLSGSSYEEAGAAPAADTGSTTPVVDSATPPAEDSSSDGPAASDDSGFDAANEQDAPQNLDAQSSDTSDDTSEMDASDSSEDAPAFDANPDAGDAQDAFNQMSRRSFAV